MFVANTHARHDVDTYHGEIFTTVLTAIRVMQVQVRTNPSWWKVMLYTFHGIAFPTWQAWCLMIHYCEGLKVLHSFTTDHILHFMPSLLYWGAIGFAAIGILFVEAATCSLRDQNSHTSNPRDHKRALNDAGCALPAAYMVLSAPMLTAEFVGWCRKMGHLFCPMFAFLHRVGTNYAFWYRHTQTQRRNNYKSRLHQRFVTTKKGLSILIAMLLCNLTIATPHIWCGQWRQLLLTNSFNDDTMPSRPTIARPDLTTGLSLLKYSRPTTVRTSITVPRHSRTVAPHLDLSRSGKATRGNTIQNPR